MPDDAGREPHLLCEGWKDFLQKRLYQVGLLCNIMNGFYEKLFLHALFNGSFKINYILYNICLIFFEVKKRRQTPLSQCMI
jgi:hypothetical protein